MFENYTYEKILEDVMERIPDNMDKREGSVIYDAAAPFCAEAAKLYIELERVLNEVFGDTASREYLIRRAFEKGIYPKDETKAQILAELKGDFEISEGARFNIDALNYVYTGERYQDYYVLECEEGGEKGNISDKSIIPIDYIEGLKSAYAAGIAVYGEDEEDTEVFRKRYLESIRNQPFGGNIADYKQKVKAIEGVGGLKVYRAAEWNGAGTVKLVIQTSDYKAPSAEFISMLQTEIDPVQNQGEGMGIAPIGHQVTVEGVNETPLNITADITYAEGYSFDYIKSDIIQILEEYFEELNQTWENENGIIVYSLQTGARLLNAKGIIDVSNICIDGSAGNYQLDKDSLISIEASSINEITFGEE